VTCLVHPYNVEVLPCLDGDAPPPGLELTLRLVRTLSGGPRPRSAVVHVQVERSAPYFLFGDSTRTGDVRPSPSQLPDGAYQLFSSVGGDNKVVFTQSCPCPRGMMKGRKGCMKKRV
jgi:hypothetical protein